MRRGFTLIELMVVAGIMAFLGTAAVGGYNAYQRGMANRGATGAASSLFKAAKERASVDRSPTMVVCYNRLIREASGDDVNAIVVGEAIAVRRAGRITYVSGQSLADEFADVIGSYDVVEKSRIQNRGGMRLWKFDDRKMTKADYTVVADAVKPLVDDVRYETYEGWSFGEDNAVGHDASVDLATAAPKGQSKVVTRSGRMKSLVYAFHDLGSGTIGASGWKVGNGYGFEFARVQLPHNFIFGQSVPSRVDAIENIAVLYFDPERGNDEELGVYFCQPDASGRPKPQASRAGLATSKGNATI